MNGLQVRLSRFWKRVSTPDWAWLPKINQDEQTRASWAKRINSYDGLPPAYRAFFRGPGKGGAGISLHRAGAGLRGLPAAQP